MSESLVEDTFKQTLIHQLIDELNTKSTYTSKQQQIRQLVDPNETLEALINILYFCSESGPNAQSHKEEANGIICKFLLKLGYSEIAEVYNQID